MSELLIELFSEEIPAGSQKSAAVFLRDQISNSFESLGIGGFTSEFFFSPRRLTIVLNNLPSEVKKSAKEVRGPKTSAPEKAIEGFSRKMGLDDTSKLTKTVIKGVEYFCYIEPESSAAVTDLIPEILTNAFDKLSGFWPKTMRWSNYALRWMRPLHNIAVIFDEKVVEFDYFHLKTNNKIVAHRLLNSSTRKVLNFAEYDKFLNDNFVVYDHKRRKDKIKQRFIPRI